MVIKLGSRQQKLEKRKLATQCSSQRCHAHAEPMLSTCWACTEHMLSTCWAHAELMLSICWACIEHMLSSCWAHVEYVKHTCWNTCWAHVTQHCLTCILDLTTSVGNMAVQKQQPAIPPANASRHRPVYCKQTPALCHYAKLHDESETTTTKVCLIWRGK